MKPSDYVFLPPGDPHRFNLPGVPRWEDDAKLLLNKYTTTDQACSPMQPTRPQAGRLLKPTGQMQHERADDGAGRDIDLPEDVTSLGRQHRCC